jgi:RNA polymerase sigma-70 factor, ECF subfamily
MDEPQLIQRAGAGDREAMQALYCRYADRVYTVVRRLAGEDALAEDWAQDTWIRAFRALPSFRGESRFGTWIHRIAVNSALHGRRWRDRRVDNEVALSPGQDVATRGQTPELKVSLERALDRIPPGMRQVLVLHDVEGYTHEEIASLLGVTAGTSKSQLFKARARMRELLRPSREVINGEAVCLI